MPIDVYEVDFNATHNAQLVQNTQHFATLAEGATAQEVAEYLNALWYTVTAIFYTAEYQFQNVAVRTLVSSTYGEFTAPYDRKWGVGGGQSLPPHDAIVIRLRTPRTGKSGKGRWYIPALPTGVQQDGLVSASFFARYQDGVDSWRLTLDGASNPLGLAWGVWSRKLGGRAWPAQEGGFQLITWARVRPVLGYQGKRSLTGHRSNYV